MNDPAAKSIPKSMGKPGKKSHEKHFESYRMLEKTKTTLTSLPSPRNFQLPIALQEKKLKRQNKNHGLDSKTALIPKCKEKTCGEM